MSKKTIGIIVVVILVVSIVASFVLLTDFLGINEQPVEPDESRILFDEYVQSFDEKLQQEFDVFLEDGVISQDEANQINFLKKFTQSEQIEFIQNGKHTDFDWDNDNMNNYFEKAIAELPYDVYNGRYAILIDTGVNTKTADSMYDFLTIEQKFMLENVQKLAYKNATITNFDKAISDFRGIVDSDSIVYVMLEGHGNEIGIAFNDGEGNDKAVGILYSEIGEKINQLKSKVTVISISACENYGAFDRLFINSSAYVLMSMSGGFIFGSSENYLNEYTGSQQFEATVRRNYDIDGNGHVSIGESYQTQMNLMEKYLQEHPDQAYKYNIYNFELANNVFLGDFSNINCLTPDNLLASWNETI